MERKPEIGELVGYKWHTCIVKAFTADSRVYLANAYTNEMITRPVAVADLDVIEKETVDVE